MGQQTPSTEQVILALRRLNSAFASSNRAVGSALGIKDGDLAVFDCLSQNGPQTPTELARATRIHLATMTGILSRLERDGWIERHPDTADRRSIRIHATGAHRLSDIYTPATKKLAELMAEWTPNQVSLFTRFLTEAGDVVEAFATELTDEGLKQEPTDRH